MSVTVQEVVRLFPGRGINGEIVEEATATAAARLELHIDLPALQVELEQAMLNFDTLPRHCWQPLTTVVAGNPPVASPRASFVICKIRHATTICTANKRRKRAAVSNCRCSMRQPLLSTL